MQFSHFLFLYTNITTNDENFLSFENDDVKPSKRQDFFISVIFVLTASLDRFLLQTGKILANLSAVES